jgi:hypothetical protein
MIVPVRCQNRRPPRHARPYATTCPSLTFPGLNNKLSSAHITVPALINIACCLSHTGKWSVASAIMSFLYVFGCHSLTHSPYKISLQHYMNSSMVLEVTDRRGTIDGGQSELLRQV